MSGLSDLNREIEVAQGYCTRSQALNGVEVTVEKPRMLGWSEHREN